MVAASCQKDILHVACVELRHASETHASTVIANMREFWETMIMEPTMSLVTKPIASVFDLYILVSYAIGDLRWFEIKAPEVFGQIKRILLDAVDGYWAVVEPTKIDQKDLAKIQYKAQLYFFCLLSFSIAHRSFESREEILAAIKRQIALLDKVSAGQEISLEEEDELIKFLSYLRAAIKRSASCA